MVGLTISMYFQQFEDFKFLFFPGGACPQPPKKPLQSVQTSRITCRRIVLILVKNPKSQFDFIRDTSIPILKNSSHKPTSREMYFVKLS